MHCGNRQVCGFSLVELMISLLLGAMLSTVVTATYLSGKQQYFYHAQMASLQENGRYALRMLSREFSMAGFFGGRVAIGEIDPGQRGADCSDSGWALDWRTPLEFSNDFSVEDALLVEPAAAFSCLDAGEMQINSDRVSIKRTVSLPSIFRGVPARGLMSAGVDRWYLRLNPQRLPQWQNHRGSDLYKQVQAHTGSNFWAASTKVLFLRNYSAAYGDGTPSLCMKTLAGRFMTTRCLVEGVENMQIEFGIDVDADGVPDTYQTSPSPSELQLAVTVKLYLLLRSLKQIVGHSDRRTYTLGPRETQPMNDAYLRRVFSTTVRLENMIGAAG